MFEYLVSIFTLIQLAAALKPITGPPHTPWLTLHGQRPLVVARGGFSGVFPDSSDFAYKAAQSVSSLRDVGLYCDLQLTKDNVGFCLPDIRLDNTTDIAVLYPKGQKTYDINGEQVTGWFALDYMADEILPNVTLIQNILSRPDVFDQEMVLVVVEDAMALDPMHFWINLEYDLFYHQHNVNPAMFLEKVNLRGVTHISSPEIGFLKSIGPKTGKKTKLVFKFLDPDAVEPTTRQPYSVILKDLPSIKQFASGILVPKSYIWPVTKERYLLPATTLVGDAHKAGLEVYAYTFANDHPSSYNYSYDPTAEYLQFVDNSQFAIDGLLTDFPITASEAIACLAHTKNATKPPREKVLIISYHGAGGDYPGSTDLAYEKAVNDGADIIDCSVYMTKDGVAFCSTASDLTKSTTAATTFISQTATIPEIQQEPGIFSFDLTWSEIQTLKPKISSPIPNGLPRNPANKHKGKFVTLSEFLDFAKTKKVVGVLINIENAAYLASKKSLDVVDVVTKALSNVTLDKAGSQMVMIQSDDTSVLDKFKDFPHYRRVLSIDENILATTKETVEEIKKFADTVDLNRNSIIPSIAGFTANATTLVGQMHAANLSVHVSVVHNEFFSIPFDVYSDPFVYLATFIQDFKVEGVVTDYPATSRAYLTTPCLDPRVPQEVNISSIVPGAMLTLITPTALPPAAAPVPPLEVADLVDPPLPSVSQPNTKDTAPANPASPDKQNSGSSQTMATSMIVSFMPILVLCLFSAAF